MKTKYKTFCSDPANQKAILAAIANPIWDFNGAENLLLILEDIDGANPLDRDDCYWDELLAAEHRAFRKNFIKTGLVYYGRSPYKPNGYQLTDAGRALLAQ